MSGTCTIRGLISIVVLLMSIFGSTLSVGYLKFLFIDEPNNSTFTFVQNKIDKRITIDTEGCVIPNLNPNDMSIRKYFDIAKRLAPPAPAPPCPNNEHRLLIDNRTHIMTMKENFKFYRIDNASRFTCCYKTFYRPRLSFGIPNKIADDRIEYSGCILFQDTIKVYHEFVNVQCTHNHKEIYNQFFLFAPKKLFTSYRANPFASDRSMYNIIILGMGSVSRHNFYRTMPKTWNMLKNYEAVELKGYNAVGADTFQNLIPVLTDLNSSELRSICWLKPQDTLDSCPYIWERFKDVGYYTALAEDTARYGVFNMRKYGFRGSPTDYYIYPFIHQTEILNDSSIKKNKARYHSKKSTPKPMPACMGDRYYFEVLLSYIESLTTTLDNAKLFGLFWESSISNYNLISPQKMDDAYVNLLKYLDLSGYLNKTILIFLSDHGKNNGGVNLSKQGQMEQRQPLSYIYTPETFRREFKLAYQNLILNKDRLTTPFDVHKTLIDLLDLSEITDDEISTRSKELYSNKRGVSLFLPIPDNRTCKIAGIRKEWCNCHKYEKVTLRNFTKLASVKQFLSKHLNDPLKTYALCKELTVIDVSEAYEMMPEYESNIEWRDFKVIIMTAPDGGLFEAMLRYYTTSKNWVLVNSIKRLNANTKSNCVDDEYVKLYCHCK